MPVASEKIHNFKGVEKPSYAKLKFLDRENHHQNIAIVRRTSIIGKEIIFNNQSKFLYMSINAIQKLSANRTKCSINMMLPVS